MKLLYLSSPFFADCDFPLIKAFQQKDIDVTYLILLSPFALKSTLFNIQKQLPKTGIFPASAYPEIKIYADYLNLDKVFVSNRTNKKSYSWSYWKETFLLSHFIKSRKFDVIHTSLYFTGFRRWFYKLNHSFVTTHHDPFPHTGEKKHKQKKIYRWANSHSVGLVILNKKQLADFCNVYNIAPEKVLVNKLGVYDIIRTFKVTSTPKPHNILFFGRISPYKGIEYLCEAMKIVRKAIPDATLTIAGGGQMYFDIEPYQSLGYFEFRNRYIDMYELAELISRCSFVVCPYTDATQSGVVMTSFALGKPVVATNVGGMGEMVEEGKSGKLIPPKDTESLARAILTLMKDDGILKTMRDYVIQRYYYGEDSWSAIADRYIDFYNKISL